MMVTLCRDSEVRSGRKVKDLMTMVPYDLSRVFIVKDSTNEARGVSSHHSLAAPHSSVSACLRDTRCTFVRTDDHVCGGFRRREANMVD
jgi:hypothetical protein